MSRIPSSRRPRCVDSRPSVARVPGLIAVSRPVRIAGRAMVRLGPFRRFWAACGHSARGSLAGLGCPSVTARSIRRACRRTGSGTCGQHLPRPDSKELRTIQFQSGSGFTRSWIRARYIEVNLQRSWFTATGLCESYLKIASSRRDACWGRSSARAEALGSGVGVSAASF
jgi:hypothetical protein